MSGLLIGIAGKKQAGKCVVGNTIIFTPNGLRRISTICNEIRGFSSIKKMCLFDESGIGYTKTSYFKQKCKTLRISTVPGYHVEGTPNHPVRIMNADGVIEWKQLQHVSVGDSLVVMRNFSFKEEENESLLNNFYFDIDQYCSQIKQIATKKLIYSNFKKSNIPSKITLDFCRVIGYFISEGNRYKNSITISNYDKSVLNDIKNTFKKEFGIVVEDVLHNGSVCGVRINRVDIASYFDYLGLHNVGSKDKNFGDRIISLPFKYLAEVLKAYFEGDGGIDGEAISCTSKSKKLIDDLQIILLSYGIISYVKKQKKCATNSLLKTKKDYYILRIYGENVIKFEQNIGFLSDNKKNALKLLIANRKDSNSHFDVIDIKAKINNFKKTFDITKSGCLIENDKCVCKIKYPSQMTTNISGKINYKTIDSCIEYFQTLKKYTSRYKNKIDLFVNDINNLKEKNYFLAPVISLEKGVADVFDISKEGTDKSFITNGLISHNTSLCEYLKVWYGVEFQTNLSYNVIQDVDGSIKLFGLESDCVGEYYSPEDVYNFNEGVKVYSFADPLKEYVCQKIMGLPREQTHGTDAQKNTLTQYKWDTFPLFIREDYSKEQEDFIIGGANDPQVGIWCPVYESRKKPRTGFMTGREVMQVVATDIFRNMLDQDIWVKATFRKIDEEKKPVALVADVRFEGEVNAIIKNGGYIIRLNRIVDKNDIHPSETALDNFDFKALGDRCLYINNEDYEINEKNHLASEWISQILRKNQ